MKNKKIKLARMWICYNCNAKYRALSGVVAAPKQCECGCTEFVASGGIMDNIMWGIDVNEMKTLKNPETIEKYLELNFIEKAMLQFKWIHEGEDVFYKMMNFYGKDKFKTEYEMHDIEKGRIIGIYKTLEEIVRENLCTYVEVKYLYRYRGKTVKNPKYEVYNKFRLIKREYEIKDNDYCEIAAT